MNQNTTSAQYSDPDFTSIDDPKLKWPTFALSMLRLGRILTAEINVRREIRAEQISRWMIKHQKEVGMIYLPKEIREHFNYHNQYLIGGGIQIEGYELPLPYRSIPHFHFTFTKIYRPEKFETVNQVPEGQTPINV